MDSSYPIYMKIAFGIVGILFVVSAAYLIWAAADGSGTSESILAAAGVLLAQTVAFLGLLQRQASDSRAARASEIEQDRLTVETALRAVEILVGEGDSYTQTRNGGAVLALVELGHLDLALALISVMWPNEDVGPEAAIQVINEAVDSDMDATRVSAASILAQNGASTFPPGQDLFHFPLALIEGWDPDEPEDVRYPFLMYLVDVADHITDDDGLSATATCTRLEPIVEILNSLRDSEEPKETYKGVATTLLIALLPLYQRSQLEAMPGPGGAQIEIEEFASQLSEEAGSLTWTNASLDSRVQSIKARVLLE